MPPFCTEHSSLGEKIDRLTETQATLVTLIENVVIDKDAFYAALDKVYARIDTGNERIYDRINTDRDKNRTIFGVLIGVITLLGSSLAVALTR